MKTALHLRMMMASALFAVGVTGSLPVLAQEENEQFIPLLAYRSGPYAPNGTPWANAKQDYLKLINARDGGVNGVRITYEECETGYATDRGVECYERLKSGGPTGASLFDPQATGISLALSEKVDSDKIPLIQAGYGRSDTADGRVAPWNFPILGHYGQMSDVAVKYMGEQEGGMDQLKGKKIAYVYHDSPYGREPLAFLRNRAKLQGFTLLELPVAHPGVEQKSTWLQVRQQRPDWVMLQGWGIMNSVALKEAQAVGFPRNRMIGGWYASAEPDVRESGMDAKGYRGVALQHSAGRDAVHADILKYVHGQDDGTGPESEVGNVLYNRGLIISMLSVEAIRVAQEQFGEGKPMTGEQVRWGLENLNLTQERLTELGFGELLRGPIKTSCEDHVGNSSFRIHEWDGTQWAIASDWIEPDQDVLEPVLAAHTKQYIEEKGITPTCYE